MADVQISSAIQSDQEHIKDIIDSVQEEGMNNFGHF